MIRRAVLYLFCLCVTAGWTARGAEDGSSVVVVYNTRVAESKDVAEHYAKMRNVPASQVLGFTMPDSEDISRQGFRELLQKPLLKALEEKKLFHFEVSVTPATATEPRHAKRVVTAASIRYLVLCYGVPLRIDNDPSYHDEGEKGMPEQIHNNGAAVDNELACLPVLENMPLTGPRSNLVYAVTNAALLSPTNGILLVARLDGPTPAIARALVDKAMEAETNGLWGRAYFDLRGITNGPFKLGDEWIGGAAEICEALGFETIVDTNAGTFPVTFPMSQIAFYAGWYDENASGPFSRPTVEFMPGAFAYHLHSYSAATLRSTKRQWCGPLLDRGVTCTMGCVTEPYLTGTPDIAMFFARFIYSGFSFGEAAYAGQHYVSWQTTVVGDPLYRPFARTPMEMQNDLERRHSKLVEWAYLRSVDSNLVRGMRLENVVSVLEHTDAVKTSAVLEEKMAALYTQEGKPSTAVYSLQQVLKLDPTPQQRVRVMLELAERLIALNREQEAYAVYQDFLKDCPDYPDELVIYRSLLHLADKLGLKDDAAKYQGKIGQLNDLRNELEKAKQTKRGM